MHGPGDVRVEDRPDPQLEAETDAVIRLVASCICGSDLWPYRGIAQQSGPTPMGHEYVGVVEVIGSAVRTLTVGDFVVGSFFASDNTCAVCRVGYQTSCIHREPAARDGAQAERMRVPLADGTLVATPSSPDPALIPHLLAASDVLAARELGAERIIAMSQHPQRQALAFELGWLAFFRDLTARGLSGVRLVTSDAHPGLVAAADATPGWRISMSRSGEFQ